MRHLKSLIIVTTLSLSPFSAWAGDALNNAQKSEVQSIVHEYIMQNPEIIMEALQELQRREKVAEAEQQKEALKSLTKDFTHDPNDPFIGNPDGDVTVVEFFDYRCGFCKRVFDDVQTLVKEDGNIRYVLKEFPVLGEDSLYAAQAAMAVWQNEPDKYFAFHSAMMTNKGGLGQEVVLDLAKDAGVNVAAMLENMESPEVIQTLRKVRSEASALGISGTPGFVVGDNIAPGAIPLTVMRQLVAAARENKN